MILKILVKGNNLIKFQSCKISLDNRKFVNYDKNFINTVLIPLLYTNFTKIVNNIIIDKLQFRT